jgi:hypothetical protein
MRVRLKILPLIIAWSAAICSMLGFWTVAGAQAIESGDAARPARFEVELVIFHHLDQAPNTPEIGPLPVLAAPVLSDTAGPSDSGSPEVSVATDPITAAGEQPAIVPPGISDQDDEPQRPPIDFLLLEPEPQLPDFLPIESHALVLDPVYQRLVRLDAYKPVLQLAWTQGARPRAVAQPYFISTADTRVTGISGTVKLSKERYLHLKLNLAFRPDAIGLAEPGFGVDPVTRRDMLGGLPPVTYRITGSRRVRAAEIHYFDHPKFGVIASVREIKPEQETVTQSP